MKLSRTRMVLAIICLLHFHHPLHAEDAAVQIQTLAEIAYKTGDLTDYEASRCRLDIYLPHGKKEFATLVWFHGGALKNGSKSGSADPDKTPGIARALAKDGLAVVAVNYRLSPKVHYPAYVEDAAASVAWVRKNIATHGGDAGRIFVAGHSAGGWLTLMLAMDPQWLKPHGLAPEDLAGFVPLSAQTMTHYTVRDERGIGKQTIIADDAAPVHFCRKKTAPMLILAADHDMAARSEENAYFVAVLKGLGNKHVKFRQMADRSHGSIAHRIADEGDPVRAAILEFTADPSSVLAREEIPVN